MATIAVYGGAINAEGIGKPWLHVFRSGITVGGTVTQFSGGANMSVDVNVDATLGVFGAWINTSANVNYFGQSDAKLTPTVTTAHPTLARKDSVVAYIDLSLISTGTTNNAGAFKVVTVPGTAAGSPVVPNNTTIQTAVGAGNPFIIGPTISVAAAATSITTGNISGTWATSALRIPRIAGGSSNTLGHLVPNSADDTLALLNATQTLGTNTTVNTRSLTNPYKFYVYRSAAATINSGGIMLADTKVFDTGSNVDVVTNKGRFTAPVTGLYYFTGCIGFQISGYNGVAFGVSLNKNGAVALSGNTDVNMFAGAYVLRKQASGLISLTTGDYVELVCLAGASGGGLQTGAAESYFQGFLVSTT